ncbi:outer membrane beta-barrel protein [uncultured Alistipes sp.]|jgi:hypothetical protein|uniref:outer membrane beta-barrel protein n=1 Tax=uncultured Alistipes sp. TaxID=538949 RepID=UPI0025FBA9B7|nr:outer membrane beta-barrel protein [uncultured Alistipes sp.]
MKKLFLLVISLLLFGVMRNANAQSFNKPKGYMGIAEIGGGLGFGDWKADRVSFSMINGYRFMPQFAVGIGVGVQMAFHDANYAYEAGNGEGRARDISLPVFLHLRSDFLNGKVSPYVAFNIGYNLFFDKKNSQAPQSIGGGDYLDSASPDGLILEPMVGVGFNVGQNRMTVGVGYLLNQMKYTLNGNPDKKMATALTLKVGYSF